MNITTVKDSKGEVKYPRTIGEAVDIDGTSLDEVLELKANVDLVNSLAERVVELEALVSLLREFVSEEHGVLIEVPEPEIPEESGDETIDPIE